MKFCPLWSFWIFNFFHLNCQNRKGVLPITVISWNEERAGKGIQKPQNISINAVCVSNMNNRQQYAFQMTETPRHLVNSILWHLLCEKHHAWLLSEERKETQDSPYLPAYQAAGLNRPRHLEDWSHPHKRPFCQT